MYNIAWMHECMGEKIEGEKVRESGALRAICNAFGEVHATAG